MLADLTAKPDQLERVTEVIVAEAQVKALAPLLQRISGIGPLLALTMVAEISDIMRCDTGQKLRGYSRLVPQLHQSGECCYTGPG